MKECQELEQTFTQPWTCQAWPASDLALSSSDRSYVSPLSATEDSVVWQGSEFPKAHLAFTQVQQTQASLAGLVPECLHQVHQAERGGG